ncbi:protein O-mannosyl-transferase TMTC1 [Corythoichthys intestinalis]|uniref:protein O-mannosyl-transferase TMTC1 n=1 Tax=Corythoichthys intestinalis TaxID=161448 RepID=UPI0025A4DFEB|nr:protein O-mannosyl-transferase TMTC1 [Corythoichthys intestinalis]XP_061809655.1 protein O-mannosyl-transferase TMTC1-like [Nerophis lumbriciformis]
MTAPGRERSSPQHPVRQAKGCTASLYAVLVALCVLCYSNSIHGELVHDDVWAIINNPDVRPTSSLQNIFRNDFWGKRMSDNSSHKSYRPFCILTFKLNILLGGMTPVYFHMVNVCLHCAVTCLLMRTCKLCVFEESHLAFITAVLFAVHPVHTEAVSGIVGRADVLACLLFLLAFLSYIRSVGVMTSEDSTPCTASAGSLLISLLLGTCAMLVKETGITVFGVCMFYDALVLCGKQLFSHLSGSGVRQLVHIWKPFFKRAFVVTTYVLAILSIRLWLMGGSMPLFSEQDNPASFAPYLLTRVLTYSYLLYFNTCLLLAPIVLCYDWQVGSIPLVESLTDIRNLATVLLSVVMFALCRHCVHSLKKRKNEVLMGILFLVFPFIPASNLFFRVGFVVAERVLYMPSMGYCILVVHGFSRLVSLAGRWGTTFLSASMLLLLLLFSCKTVQQNKVWLSREALFSSGIWTLPHNAKVHYNYANYLKDNTRHQEAIYHYSIALRLYPRHASAMNNLGTLTHNPEEAERYYRRALDINPQHNRALFNLGNLLKLQGKEKEAETLLLDSIHYGPHFADAYSSLASLYADQKRYPEAHEMYLKGIENCPDNSDLHNNYGVFLVDTGKEELAAAHYQQAIQLKPSHYVAMVNLGRLLRSSNLNKEAEFWYKRALQVTRTVEILAPLGALYYNTGRYDAALRVYREAVSLQPENTDIWLALAQVLTMAGHTNESEKMTRDIISRGNSCIECYRLLSSIYSKHGNHAEALEALNGALQLNPNDLAVKAELYFSKGNQLREMNQLDLAFESYKLAVELKPDQSQAWMNMGGIQHIKGDYAAARMYYQRALNLNPGSKLLKENLEKLDRLEKRITGVP